MGDVNTAIPGDSTRLLLCEYGVEDWECDLMLEGDGDWIIHERELVLFAEGTAQRGIVLTCDQERALLNAYEYERRGLQTSRGGAAFPPGSIRSWTGAERERTWATMASAYRAAVGALARECQSQRDCVEPYLFLCRHTLELQLKAIIATAHENEPIASHKICDLWPLAELALRKEWQRAATRLLLPRASVAQQDARRLKDRQRETRLASLPRIKAVLRGYIQADPHSFQFRYPTDTNGDSMEHKDFILNFDLAAQTAAFEEVAACLEEFIRELTHRNLCRKIGKWIQDEGAGLASDAPGPGGQTGLVG